MKAVIVRNNSGGIEGVALVNGDERGLPYIPDVCPEGWDVKIVDVSKLSDLIKHCEACLDEELEGK